jgi:hypothetical protein
MAVPNRTKQEVDSEEEEEETTQRPPVSLLTSFTGFSMAFWLKIRTFDFGFCKL